MTREQLEHLIRAAGVIAEDDAIVIVGSQAILGQFPDAPDSMRVSMEASSKSPELEEISGRSRDIAGESPDSAAKSRVSPQSPRTR